jgi:predicted RND superfamily exporter protein
MKRTDVFWYTIIITCICLAVWVAPKIPFQSSPEAYTLIPEEDREALEQFQDHFKTDGFARMIIVLKHERKWHTYEDFLYLDSATQWWHVNDSVQALSITNVPFPVSSFFGIRKKNFLPLHSEKKFKRWYERSQLFEDITSKFLSRNRKYTLLFIPSQKYNTRNFERFKSNFKKQGITLLPLDYVAMENELQAVNQRDSLLIGGISLILILSLFYLLTGTFRGLVFIFGMIAFSLGLTTLFVYLSGISFTIHMVAIPCMLIVLSFTDLMHLLYTHQHMKNSVVSRVELREKLRDTLNRPMIWTSLTNMIGFVLFLFLADSEALTNISLVSIIGVVFSFLTARYIAIQLLQKETAFLKIDRGKTWMAFHKRSMKKLGPWRGALLVAMVAIAVLLSSIVISSSQIEQVPYTTKGKHPSFEAANIMGDHFFGDKTGAIHIVFSDKNDLWNTKALSYLEHLEAYIQELFPIRVISSPTILAKRYHRFERNGHPGAYSLPSRYDSLMLQHTDMLGGSTLVKNNKGFARVLFSFSYTPLQESLQAWDKLNQYVKNNPSPKGLDIQVSGTAYHNDRATQRFSENILIGMLISISFGAAITFLYIRSWRVLIAAFLANVLPLLTAFLTLIILGSPINPISLFFFTVIMGLCVDDTIYLILHKGQKVVPVENKNEQHYNALYPIAITSVVLAVGFSAFLFSGYTWLQPFGWAFLIGILTAFVFDAFFLALFTERNRIFDGNG